MTATFGTPVAAMLLAVELLLFEWKPRSFVPVAIASVVAAGWRAPLLGGGLLFPLISSAALPPAGLLAAAALGVLCGLASGLLTRMVYTAEDLFQRLPLHWMWWPALGGVAIGLGGLIEPRALGVGYDNIAALLHGGMTVSEVIRLVLVKALIWSIALGSGTSGGVLAPLLIMGGALGALFGDVMPVGDTSTWALVGMASMMGGTMRSPLTAIVFALELTGNIGALLPLAIACALAHATTVLTLRRSILTEKVARRGHHVSREYVVDPFELLRVADIMVEPVSTLLGDLPIEAAIIFFCTPGNPPHHRSYPVVDKEGRLLGMLTRADVLRWTREGRPAGQSLAEALAGGEPITAFTDETAGAVVDRMTERGVGRVPVLRRSDGVVVGLVARRDLLRARTISARNERDHEVLIRLRVPASAPAPQ
jgi:CBS domain-containing protein